MRPFRLLIAAILLLLVVALPATAAPATQAGAVQAGIPPLEDLPAGVRAEPLLEDMHLPIAMAFDPGGRLFYTEKDGKVRLFANGQLQAAPVIEFKVNTQSERGLLGIAIDPAFNTNHYIYVYMTCDPSGGCEPLQNRVVRFVEQNGVGSNPTLLFNSTQSAGNHNGGNIHFGPDGMLYISIGENAQPANSQDLGTTQGKIHRIKPDGTIPADNPKFTQQGALPSIYAYGLRNSFDFTFDPIVKGRIFASENGPGCDDEMNRIEAGYNYGWRNSYPCDDPTPDGDYNSIKPLWYAADDCCMAPTGIVVYNGDSIPQWKGHIFMVVYDGQMYHFTPNADRTELTAAGTLRGVTANMDVETAPDGTLWYMQGGGYSDGTLMRLVGQGQPQPTPGPTSQPGAPTIPGTSSRTFPETGKTVRGLFLEYWDAHGGLAQQGFPISELITEKSDLDGKTYTVQYFERAVFEYHPENQSPNNVLLSQLGTFQYRAKYPDGAPNQQANTSAGSQLFNETGKRVGGKFLEYWNTHGGLAQQGLPISEEFTEKSDLDGKTYTVQYFERAVFELHPENQPPYDVLLSQLGTFQYKDKYGK
jgi:glucose/arabinose dehydrogenase